MRFINPHLVDAIAYLILTILVMRIGFRVLMMSRFTRLSAGGVALAKSKQRLINLLSLEAIRVSPLEAGTIVMAHVMLVSASAALFLYH